MLDAYAEKARDVRHDPTAVGKPSMTRAARDEQYGEALEEETASSASNAYGAT